MSRFPKYSLRGLQGRRILGVDGRLVLVEAAGEDLGPRDVLVGLGLGLFRLLRPRRGRAHPLVPLRSSPPAACRGGSRRGLVEGRAYSAAPSRSGVATSSGRRHSNRK